MPILKKKIHSFFSQQHLQRPKKKKTKINDSLQKVQYTGTRIDKDDHHHHHRGEK